MSNGVEFEELIVIVGPNRLVGIARKILPIKISGSLKPQAHTKVIHTLRQFLKHRKR